MQQNIKKYMVDRKKKKIHGGNEMLGLILD